MQALRDDYKAYRKAQQPELTENELSQSVAIAEGQLVIDGLLEYRKRRDSFGVLSLSEDPLQLLMWTHYADEHRGAVIELDIWHPRLRPGSDGGDRYSGLEQVRYTREKIFGLPTPEKMIQVLSTKSPEWAYEREWRLVRTVNMLREAKSSVFLCDFDLSAVVAIYLGARFPANALDSIASATTRPEGAHIKVKKVHIQPHRFELRATDVTDFGWKLLHREHHFGKAADEALTCLPMDTDEG